LLLCVLQNYFYAPGWSKYRIAREAAAPAQAAVLQEEEGAAGEGKPEEEPTHTDAAAAAAAAAGNATPAGAPGSSQPSTLKVAVTPGAGRLVSVLLAYATVTSTTQRYAEAVTRTLKKAGNLQVCLFLPCGC
jgi:hypothetical protein